jgi:hypothetical protein
MYLGMDINSLGSLMLSWKIDETCTRLELRNVSCVADVLSMTVLFKVCTVSYYTPVYNRD